MELSLMQRFADPALFEQLTNGEKAMGALITTVMGMGITFIVLALLWGLIALMTKMMNTAETKKTATTKEPQMVGAMEASTLPTQTSSIQDMEDGNPELIAVIMAAIAASEGSDFKNNLIVRKINRIAGNSPAWGKAGGTDCIESRKF